MLLPQDRKLTTKSTEFLLSRLTTRRAIGKLLPPKTKLLRANLKLPGYLGLRTTKLIYLPDCFLLEFQCELTT